MAASTPGFRPLILGGGGGEDVARLNLGLIQLLKVIGVAQCIIERIGCVLGGLIGSGLSIGCLRDGLLCGSLGLLCGLELRLAGRDVVVHDVIVGCLCRIDSPAGRPQQRPACHRGSRPAPRARQQLP